MFADAKCLMIAIKKVFVYASAYAAASPMPTLTAGSDYFHMPITSPERFSALSASSCGLTKMIENDTKTFVWAQNVSCVFIKMKTDRSENAYVSTGPDKTYRQHYGRFMDKVIEIAYTETM